MSRSLSARERALWAKVAASVRPLPGRSAPKPAALDSQSSPKPPQTTPETSPKSPRTHPVFTRNHAVLPPKKPVSPAHATLDGSWDKRLARGLMRPDRILDLHDHSLDRAHQALAIAVEEGIAQGQRLLLVITGKGRADRPGRIRQELSHWLETDFLRRHVAALRPASLRHGGSGAFYLILKRKS